jgi:hypothetical protein
MRDLNVVLIDDNDIFIKLFKNAYVSTHIFNSWSDFVNSKLCTYDLVIINFDIIKRSKLCMLDEIFEHQIHKSVLILIDAKYERLPYFNQEHGYVIKSDNISKIEIQVMKLINSEIKIINLLHDLGISSNMRGYKYLLESIKIMLSENITYITKELYPKIAIKFGTNICNVERSIRHAIEVGFNRGDLKKLHQYFGRTIKINKDRPTNYNYIQTLVEILKIKG